MLSFLVIAPVVLPLLPDAPQPLILGLNPRFVWLMVVFIAAIDLAAYLFVRFYGAQRGYLLAGAMGGLVSSTATTVSMSNKTRATPEVHRAAGMAIVVASTIMLGRLLLEVTVVNREILPLLVAPIALMVAATVAVAWFVFRGRGAEPVEPPRVRNPFRIMPALVFGLFFAAVILATEWLHARFGASGVYAAALVSGLVDVDAVTLSLSRLAGEDKISQAVAAGILLVAASNSAFKIGVILLMGTRRLAGSVALCLGGAILVATGFVIWFGMG
ncbi:MAG: DUF4010 domain-containing protein [Euryarchaeota archaeon]|nr:DUF4010 domain-containing protein [Euryarchaeota archaeon]